MGFWVLVYILVCIFNLFYVLRDASSRKLSDFSLWVWGITSVVFSVLILPFYWAHRPLKKGEAREGGYLWNVFRNFIIIWTFYIAASILPAVIFISSPTGSEWLLFPLGIFVWVMIAVPLWVLGNMFRKTGYVEEGPTGPLEKHNSIS